MRRAKLYPWEYGLGDKAYVGEAELLTEFKGKGLSSSDIEWTTLHCNIIAVELST